jgi:hypothetical protein
MQINATRALATGVLVLAVAGSITCGENLPVPPDPQNVASITVVGGNDQAGVVGQPLPDPVVVVVSDANGDPVPDVRVAFLAPHGSSSPDTAVSSSTGRASTTWALPTATGAATLIAHVAGAPAGELTAVVSATGSAAEADTIFVVSGQDQAGPSSRQLPESLKVGVTDQYGNPVSGVAVTWTWTGDGTVTPASTITDAAGHAAAARTLGGNATTMLSRANADGLKGSPAIFNHRVVQPASVVILTQASANAVSGVPFSRQPAVQVRDGSGAPLDGVGVVVSVESGGGILSGTKTVVSSGGTATFTNLALSGATGAQVLRFTAGPAFALSSPITVTTPSNSDRGVWSAPAQMPLVAVHVTLMPNGKLLLMSRTQQPYVWDPTDPNSFTQVPTGTNLFCSGHTLMADGRVFVVGGHIAEDTGLPDANIFDPATNTWSRQPNMLKGRWYPTATVLSNGEILVTGGRDEMSAYAETPEIWTGTEWRRLTGTGVPRPLPYYPRMFVAPNGKTFFAGEWETSRYFDPSGNGRWEPVINRVIRETRDYGSAVMYEPGKIIYIGGGGQAAGKLPENTAEIIDLNQGSPSWSLTGSMAFRRRHMNATLLPDGQILATGGTSSQGFNNASGAVHAAEMWNPATGQWTIMAASAIDRVYHSTALLLPDGRVLLSGSGEGGGGVNERTYEFYSPPYLFKGPRPTITSAPATVSYGQNFQVQTPDAAVVSKVTWIRLGSVTHAFDASQRFMSLSFSTGAGELSVTAPANANGAPPGHYMLTILNGTGVPSVAKIVRIQ